MDTAEFKNFVSDLVQKSEEIIVPRFRQEGLAVELKRDRTVVTEADRNTEAALREMILKNYPAHGIIGEEFGTENSEAEFVWVLDPIDGTISFVGGCPLFGTLIGLLYHGQPILGCINQPILRQCCLGDGLVTTLNNKAVSVRPCPQLAAATLLATDVLAVGKFQHAPAFEELCSAVNIVRTWGDCYGYLLVATGYADIMLDPIMNPWDLLPIIPVIQGAGGTITSWNGSSAIEADSCIAASPDIHGQVLKHLTPAML